MIIGNSISIGRSAMPDYLCFTANAVGSTITLQKQGSLNWVGSYSRDRKKWTSYVPGTTGAITLTNVGDKIYFKGLYGSAPNANDYLQFTMTGSISACGNIMSLCSGYGFENVTTIPYSNCFYKLFNNCTSLTSTPSLPATTLAEACYRNMFEGCTSLASAPTLPAKTLVVYGYLDMFKDCTSLTTAPKLPATTLGEQCYAHMFEGCTNLTTPPELPATTLVAGCYVGMFWKCTALIVSDSQTAQATHAWRIPTDETFVNTYLQGSMFSNCAGVRASDNMAGQSGQSYTYYTQNEPI